MLTEYLFLQMKTRPRLLCLTVVLLVCFLPLSQSANAQRLAIKSNLLADAIISPNLGVEMLLSPRWTLDLSAHCQPFQSSNSRHRRHWLLQPELRRWLCNPFAGHFVGVHLLGGSFDVGGIRYPFGVFHEMRNYYHDGWLAGCGISYGYHRVLSPHWGIEASVGIGSAYMKYDRYQYGNNGEKETGAEERIYFGPTRIAISLVYMIR
jgi:hypothetical protein